MSLKIWILFMFGFRIYQRLSAQLCVRRFVNGEWISKGDCGSSGRMSEMQKELQRKIKDEKKCNAGYGWTVFQRIINGDVDFYRNWADYVNGFGNSEGDFWLGLEKLHELTKDGNMELEINMILKSDGTHWVAKYSSSFRIGPASDNYRLHVSGYSGNATHNAYSTSNNQQFTTYDAEHDVHPTLNCAYHYGGVGWWYGICGSVNLNGNFNKTGQAGIWWGTTASNNLLRFTEMKIRERA